MSRIQLLWQVLVCVCLMHGCGHSVPQNSYCQEFVLVLVPIVSTFTPFRFLGSFVWTLNTQRVNNQFVR